MLRWNRNAYQVSIWSKLLKKKQLVQPQKPQQQRNQWKPLFQRNHLRSIMNMLFCFFIVVFLVRTTITRNRHDEDKIRRNKEWRISRFHFWFVHWFDDTFLFYWSYTKGTVSSSLFYQMSMTYETFVWLFWISIE